MSVESGIRCCKASILPKGVILRSGLGEKLLSAVIERLNDARSARTYMNLVPMVVEQTNRGERAF
jgi:hypothetical protein